MKNPTIIHIDDDKEATHTISVLLLDDALKLLIKNGDLDKEKLANTINIAKDELFELNKNSDDNLMKMAIFMNANTLQIRYLTL